jgi:hypothetical protein
LVARSAGATAAVVLLVAGVSAARTAPSAFPDLEAACAAGRPYLVTTCFPAAFAQGQAGPAAPSVVLFQDTPDDRPQYMLGSQADVGPIYGLAYSHREGALYAGAFRKRSFAPRPGGLGAVYRLDLATRTWRTFVTVPNAFRVAPRAGAADATGQQEAGKVGLGDVDLNDDETELFVTNLYERRIYHYALPDGTLLGSFSHGAAAEPWADAARPFGLAFYDGRLYHGVVNSGERAPSELAAMVYSSASDGSDMRQELSVGLNYRRGTATVSVTSCPERPGGPCEPHNMDLRWRPWNDRYRNPVETARLMVYPMPLIGDLAFDPAGNLTIGLRDRLGDTALPQSANYYGSGDDAAGLSLGDLLYAVRRDGTWQATVEPEHFDDSFNRSDEGAQGALATDWGAGLVAATTLGQYDFFPYQPLPAHGIAWYDAASGRRVARESVCVLSGRLEQPRVHGAVPPAQAAPLRHDEGINPASLGDLEVLCGPAVEPTPSPSARPTSSPSPTPTPTRTTTPTASATASPTPPPTPTATPIPHPLHLPVALREACAESIRRVDVVLVLDSSSSMLQPTGAGRTKLAAATAAARVFLDQLHLDVGDQAAVATFNADAALLAPLGADRAALDLALAGISTAQFTRIDRGIAVAHAELTGPRHRPSNTPVMIVLTDGRANPVPVSVAEGEAQTAKDAGIVLFTIGLGDDLDVEALRRMASRPAYFYAAPDAEDLADIYRGIAVAIPCPAGAFWGGR